MDAIALTRTLLIVCLFGLGPITTDLYLPALPLIGRELGGSVADVQLTLSIYLFGFAAAQLVLGPLSDRLGRKPVLLAGLFVYLLGSLGCMLAPNISLLVLARLVQAVGACSGPVVGRAMIRDLYAPPDMARILAYVSSAMAIAPMLGPVIGGWLTVWFGWRANFAALLSIALVLAACAWRWLPESNAHRDPLATSPARIVGNFRTLFADRVFVGYSLCFGAAYGALFSFISGSSFVFIEIYRVPPQWYGASFALAVLGYIFGALMSGRLASRAPADAMIRVGGALGAAAALAMLPLAATAAPYFPRDAAIPDADTTRLGVPWRPIVMVGIGLILFYMVDTATTAWGPLYLASEKVFAAPATSASLYALATMPYLVATLLARLVGDAATARYGAATMIRGGAVAGAVGLAVVVFAPTWPVAVAGFFVVGLGMAVVAPLSFSAAARIAGGGADPAARQRRVDAVIARFNQFNYVGALLGSVLTGAIGSGNLRIGYAVPMVAVLGLVPLARHFGHRGRPA